MALATTNRAQRDMVASTQNESAAIQHRLIELNLDGTEFAKEDTATYSAAYSEAQRDCPGAMGAVIHRLIVAQGVVALNKGVMHCVTKASEMLDAKQDARFQYRALGAMLYLQILLRKVGLEMFDTATLVAEFKKAHANGLSYIAENILPTGGVELMQVMLNDLKPKTLITENETQRRGRGQENKFDLPLNERMPDKVLARHITAMGWTYVSGQAVKEWCGEKKVSERDMLNDCKKAGVLIPPNSHMPNRFSQQVDLFRGTREENAAWCSTYKVDVRKLAQATGADWHITTAENVVPITRRGEGSAAPAQPEVLAS